MALFATGACAILTVCAALAYRHYERQFMLEFVPDALGVHSISYRLEESWGFGPGGNEAGIRIYPLPLHIAKDIEQRGLDFFRTLPPNARQAQRSWRGDYGEWKPTPITASSHWPAPTTPGPLKVYDYVCKYGFCIDIAPDVLEDAQAIINSPGSYYAYGRIGVMVVSPARQQVLYLYNG